MDAIKEVLLIEKRREQSEVLGVLDMLRRSRKLRGGTGAPLDIPRHLSEAKQTILITDAESVDQKERD